MKNTIITIILSSFVISSYALRDINSTKKNSFSNKAATCAAAQTKRTLEYNNVSALIETGGVMWQDRSNAIAAYEVPKGSEQYLIFSGSLWIGGEDVNGQLKLAAMKYGNAGNDFWTGPLSVTPNTGNPAIGINDFGPATIDAETCSEYDKFYTTTRDEILEFNGWFETPDADKGEDYPGYTTPSSILNWPAHGDLGKFQDFYLAPFYDRDGDGVYNPGNGDYPWYDIKQEVDCRNDRQITLYGDYNRWWVFNDKGGIHTESGGEPIGMEIRGQAFAFATTDEINNMTFYNYELINRSTQTLTNTYFAFYTDADLGCAYNDYVGCDIQRGLGFMYNGTNDDTEIPGTGSCTQFMDGIPAAIGIDFFEGPYQDNDGIDNPLTTDVNAALAQKGIPYKGLGIGYGDSIIDNERFGMRKFTFYTNGGGFNGDPDDGTPEHFYSYMEGFWKNNQPFYLGGNAFNTGNDPNTPVDYVFFGDTDPYLWASQGLSQSFITDADGWTEYNVANNTPGDRRMVQSAGPFTLEPGATNNITVGAIYSKAQSGDAWQSVIDMRTADDKAQALFDNCFRILDGPNAPDVTVQELDKSLILYLSNPTNSNNFNEQYEEKDPIIEALGFSDDTYKFQGYKIYQVSAEDVSVSDLDNVDVSRLVAQCDIVDSVATIVNYEKDPTSGLIIPTTKVEGANTGIAHTFEVNDDLFADGITELINHKTYYYIAIAYGYNNYEDYNYNASSGQNAAYFQGRKSPIGSIKTISAIPHIPTVENGGSIINAKYGDGPKITRIEGRGNAENVLELTQESEDKIIFEYTPKEVTYENNNGPIDIKVIDPLNVLGGNYELNFIKDSNDQLDSANWVIIRNGTDSIYSDKTITLLNEQIIPEWGISVNIKQYIHEVISGNAVNTEFLESSIEFDGENQWFTGLSDLDGEFSQNWIRSGTVDNDVVDQTNCLDPSKFNDKLTATNSLVFLDGNQNFEKILEGTWAPYVLTANENCNHAPIKPSGWNNHLNSLLSDISSVDIVITADKNKWTRVPVLEAQDERSLSWDGNTDKMTVKKMPSVDKFGTPTNSPSTSSNNINDANFVSGVGMSWFPGYAIDVQTGERLNLAFSEDSWLGNENGNDMLFNPTSNIYTEFGGPSDANSVLFGGKHYIYVFRNADKDDKSENLIKAYDNGYYMKEKLIDPTGGAVTLNYKKVWEGCMYVGVPLLSESAIGLSDQNDPYSYIESDVKIKIRVSNNYRQHADNGLYVEDGPTGSVNEWYNKYSFNMDDIATQTQTDNTDSIKDSIMNMINVVPNPYYAYSNYETGRLDNRIKIVNLPDECTIKIYTVSGTLVRTFTKDDNRVTSIDWDLTNQAGIPIAGGMYLIHVDVPSIDRERILKWFGVVRPPDLKNF